jgi:hypothetical protein
MGAYFFLACIFLELLACTLVTLKLVPDRQTSPLGKALKGVRLDGRDGQPVSQPQGIFRFASLFTLGIALTCLEFGLLMLVLPRPESSPIPRSDDPSLLLAITGLGIVLTFATWAGALIVAAPIMLGRCLRNDSRGRSLKPSRMSAREPGVADQWLDGP